MVGRYTGRQTDGWTDKTNRQQISGWNVYIQSDNLEKFLKLCIESSIYYMYMWLNGGAAQAWWSGTEYVHCKQSVSGNV